MNGFGSFAGAMLAMAWIATAAAGGPRVAGSVQPPKVEVARGAYLVGVSACNDCHTPGYVQRDGRIPDELLLTGDATAYEGPWGTRFATNLRLTLLRYNDEEWLHYARGLRTQPAIPGHRLGAMSDADLLAVLRYVQWLGPRGEPAPQPLEPGDAWIGPVVRYTATTP